MEEKRGSGCVLIDRWCNSGCLTVKGKQVGSKQVGSKSSEVRTMSF